MVLYWKKIGLGRCRRSHICDDADDADESSVMMLVVIMMIILMIMLLLTRHNRFSRDFRFASFPEDNNHKLKQMQIKCSFSRDFA